MNIGRLGVWTNQLDSLAAADALRLAAELESLGYSALWLGEVDGREALTQAAMVLGATSSMTIATGIASVYGRDPVTMAQAQRTLLEAFGERFVLGLGISHPWFVEQVRGVRFGPRVPTMLDYLDRMDAAPFGPSGADKHGARVIGAVGPKMMSLAAERASGVLPLGMPVEHTAGARKLMGPDAFIGVIQPVLLAPDGPRARAIARQYVAESLPNRAGVLRELGYSVDLNGPGADRLIEAAVAWGEKDAIVARLKAQLDAGADHVALSVIDPEGAPVPAAQWRELADLSL